MKKSILLWTKTTYVATFILFLLCLTFSCQQQVDEGLTEEEAKALVERDLEIYNEGNLTFVNEHIDSNYMEHYADNPEDLVGIDAFKEKITNLRTRYPDFNCTVEELIVKDDRIVWRWIITGTNTGPIGDLPPTGKKIRIEGVGILRVVDGKIVERLPYYNEANMLRQLGYTITPPEVQSEQ
jgi:steroid delta-isomerase-like uncharacterized protein